MKVIKYPLFTIEASKIDSDPSRYSVLFKDMKYARGCGTICEMNGVKLVSSACPQEDGKTLYLPGTSSQSDNDAILCPKDLIEHLEKSLDENYKTVYIPNVAVKNRKFNFLTICKDYTSTSCKETACDYVVKGTVAKVGIGITFTKDNLKQLNLYLAKLPEESKLNLTIENEVLVIEFTSKWWNCYYRIGWLFLAVRIIAGHAPGQLHDHDFMKVFDNFVNNYTLKGVGWSGACNWQFHWREYKKINV